MINCDICKKDFDIDQKITWEDGVKIKYFTCPNCKTNYLISIESKEMREIIEQRKKIKKKYNKSQSSIQRLNLMERDNKLKEELLLLKNKILETKATS